MRPALEAWDFACNAFTLSKTGLAAQVAERDLEWATRGPSIEGFKRVYIAHPLRGADAAETERNRYRASELTAYAADEYKIAPVCSWIVLSAHWTEEQGRALGLKIDKALIEVCEELWLCGPVRALSQGMQVEHNWAVEHGVKIVDMRGVLV